MSVTKFKFTSPGVFVDEIDNSQLTGLSNDIGPVVIGRSERGPALKPVKVNSFSEFIEVFGNPIPGNQSGDVYRDGNYLAPTYGPYAVQAYLKNSAPCTFVRLLGQDNDNATSAGIAGWQTTTTSPSLAVASNGGAFGLFVAPSGSNVTGTLAAIFYLNSACSIGLSGSHTDGTTIAPATSKYFINSNGATTSPEFKLAISQSSGIVIDTKFDFSETSEYFIRKVFNTNPVLANSSVTTTTVPYWLGESFEANVLAVSSSNTVFMGVILPLMSGSEYGGNFRKSYQEAKTGWFIGQDLTNNTGSYSPTNQQKLFRLVGRNAGEWLQKNLKVSISDIKRSPDILNRFGSFSVVIRRLSDTDNKVEIVEQFNNCNLNPQSPDYVSKKIGDKYQTWDDTERRYKEYGDYDNLSSYVRVEMNSDVAAGSVNSEYLPFGFFGPTRFKTFALTTGSIGSSFVSGGIDVFGSASLAVQVSGGGGAACTASYEFPKLRLRVSASEGNITDKTKAYFGIDTTWFSSRLAPCVKDVLAVKPGSISDFELASSTEYSFVFSLDDLRNVSGSVYVSGSRAAGTSYRAASSYNVVIQDLGANRFTAPFYGGFDGLDIKEKEPFNNTDLSGQSELTSYAFNSLKVAIDCLRDPEVVEFDVATMPGITNSGLTTSLIDMCESRKSALAIVDISGDYEPDTENTQTVEQRLGNVNDAITAQRSYGQNSSYGAVYFNWCQAKDSINGATLWVPPTVPVLGTYGYTKRVNQVWFAPAGFTRGGLTNGAGGIPIVGVRMKLSKTDRDKLYDAHINPIASFPAEGIVVFGQRTLQVTPSALDRVNVRRLANHIKRELQIIGSTLLFEPNVQATWNRFLGQAEPFLAGVKANYGVDAYRLILDETTTTPDLIDRNILYAKCFIVPTKAIEGIAIDFVISNSTAGFEGLS